MSRLHANQWRTLRPEATLRSLRARRWIAIIPFVLAVLLVTACADDDGDRQFATDPRTPRPTEPVASPADAAPIDRQRPVASPEALVDRRGAPQVIYGLFDRTLWSFGPDGQQQVANGVVEAFDASPGGERVAIVTSSFDGGETTYDIAVLAPDGEVDQRFDAVLTVATTAATPDARAGDGAGVSLSWAPQGRHLLFAHPSGRLVDISIAGDVREIETRASLAGIVQADWSPRGDAIGVVIRDQSGAGRLALIDPEEQPSGLNVIAPIGDASGTERSVEAFAWKAHGDGVLYLEGIWSQSGVTEGRVVAWDQASNSTQVMATGGQAGPAGSVASFGIAPDGKAVVYSVWLPTPDGWSFIGIFVRSLVHGEVYRVPVDTDVTVLETWWIRDGLAWALVEGPPAEAASIELRMVDGSGVRHQLGTVDIAVPDMQDASPVAPVASPVATPVAPHGTPEATPVAATPAA